MTVHISPKAEEQLDSFADELRKKFVKHFRKIDSMPPRRHMKHGIPYHVEEVTKQARIIYAYENQDIHILHCFQNHKEYERWYKSYK